MCRLLVMEYALPTRAYTTLGWPADETYPDKGEQFRWLHRTHLSLGTFGSITRLLCVLALGKQTVRAVGHPGLIHWDPNGQGFMMKDIHLRLEALK